eukprot:447587-Rhodomonas_salina.4
MVQHRCYLPTRSYAKPGTGIAYTATKLPSPMRAGTAIAVAQCQVLKQQTVPQDPVLTDTQYYPVLAQQTVPHAPVRTKPQYYQTSSQQYEHAGPKRALALHTPLWDLSEPKEGVKSWRFPMRKCAVPKRDQSTWYVQRPRRVVPDMA